MKENKIGQAERTALTQILKESRYDTGGIIVCLAWKQGMTRNEIRKLTWNDISFQDGQMILPDRTIPLDSEAVELLRSRYDFRGRGAPFVVPSDRLHKQMQPESISRLARITLNRGGLQGVSLVDLRRDYIITQLELHDWPYAARVSGVTPATLYANFAGHMSLDRNTYPGEAVPAQTLDEFRLWKVLQAEGDSPTGLALWLAWKMGMTLQDIASLTWEQVDLNRNVIQLKEESISINETVRRLLQSTWARNCQAENRHVLLTPLSQKPFDQARLSRIARAALIRGGLENVSLGALSREAVYGKDDMTILQYTAKNGSISRQEVMELLGLQKVSAYQRLHRLTAAQKLTRNGGRYYLAGTVASPEKQYETVCAYLEQTGCACRQELAELLHVDVRKCSRTLRHMMEEGKLVREGQRYYLAGEHLADASK